MAILKTMILKKNLLTIFQFQRKLLMDAHKVAHGALWGACAEGGPSVSEQGDAMLLMVKSRFIGGDETVLRSLDEMQPAGTVNHTIPYRYGCSYTLFQGEPAKSCRCSNLFFLSIFKLESFTWGSIAITEFR